MARQKVTQGVNLIDDPLPGASIHEYLNRMKNTNNKIIHRFYSSIIDYILICQKHQHYDEKSIVRSIIKILSIFTKLRKPFDICDYYDLVANDTIKADNMRLYIRNNTDILNIAVIFSKCIFEFDDRLGAEWIEDAIVSTGLTPREWRETYALIVHYLYNVKHKNEFKTYNICDELVIAFKSTDILLPNINIKMPFDNIILKTKEHKYWLTEYPPIENSNVSALCMTVENKDRTSLPGIHLMSKDMIPINKHIETMEDIKSRERILFTYNTLLYITNRQDDVFQNNKELLQKLHEKMNHTPKGKKRDQIKARLRQEQNNTIYIVGAKYKTACKEKGIYLGPKVKRHVVRGHWKNQHYGPGREEVKQIWIEPYLKGGLAGDVPKKKDYKVNL